MSRLSIVVPFYDEEAAVEGVLRACVRAAAALGPGAEVVAVDDGSRDRSAVLAAAVPGVRVLSHETNRGYGAALKTGFAAARGDWLAFLDADGTLDPAALGLLWSKAKAEDLDMVVGARLHAQTRMPFSRVFGNRLFVGLAAVLGGTGLTDVASGMRVLSRAAYERMAPLPDGMHFTPALSARALLDPALRVGELPVPYDERRGASKLEPLADGLRFLRVILEAALVYRPRAVFGWLAAALAALGTLLFCLRLSGPAAPLGFILEHGRAEPWMYFRFMLAGLCVALAAFLAALGLVAQALVSVVHRARDGSLAGPDPKPLTRRLPVLGGLAVACGVAANAGPLASYARTGHISNDYWTLPLVGGVLCGVGVQLWGLWVAARIAELLWEREKGRGP